MALSFAGNGTITGLSVGGLPDGVVDEDTLANNAVGSGKLASGVGGKVLNTYHVAQKGEVTTTSTSPVDLAGMTLTTGSLATVSSKLLISVVVYASNSNVSRGCYFNVYANSTLLDVGDHSGSLTSQSRVAMFTGTSNTSADGNCAFSQFFYSPNSTAAQTIKVKWWVVTDTGQLNRSQANGNDAYRHRDVSSIIVQEISS